jgi:hypothetical protein
MKKAIALLCLTALASIGFSQTRLICRMASPSIPWMRVTAAKYGLTFMDVSYSAPFALYQTTKGQNVAAVQKAMLTDPQVMWVEDDDKVVIPETQKGSTIAAIVDRNALYAENTKILSQIHWSSSLAQQSGRAVRIAILDTGLSPNLKSLWSKVVNSYNLIEPGAAYDLPKNTDSNGNHISDEGAGHGTMIAGIIDQIAPQAQLVIIRVADSDGNSSAWRIIKGLTGAVASGAEVANLSLGTRVGITALHDVLDWTDQQGLTIVCPDGNDSSSTADYPAQIGKIISVAGVDPNSVKAAFSNWFSGTLCSAPSTGIKSYWWNGNLGIWSGTSFAAPFVAATIADALRKTSKIAPATLRGLIKANGDSIDVLNPSYRGNLGTLLDVAKLETAIVKSSSGGK